MKTLEQLIKLNKIDWKSDYINEDNFPFDENWKEPEYKLYHFDKYISSEDAIKKMNKDGYEPATLQDMLNWDGWNGKDWIVALGQVWLDFGGFRRVSVLHFSVGSRRLGLGWFVGGWVDDCRFLAVKQRVL